MSITDILIILGCLAGGYWLVSSVMGPGIDITRRDAQKPADQPPALPPPAAAPRSAAPLASLPRSKHPTDWHLLLDVPRTATRAEIEAAFRHQQKKAQAAGDRMLEENLRRARDAGLAQIS